MIGFAAYGFLAYNYIDGVYERAFDTTYYGTGQPPLAQPSLSTFCSTAAGTGDNCDPSKAGTSGACQLGDLHCWWHSPVTWTQGCQDCGRETLKYAAGTRAPRPPGVPSGYAPKCSSSPLPADAVIVGDTASSIPAPYGCGPSWHNNGGTMTWDFAAASTSPPTYPSKIDFHQIGGGYGGHFWFTHTIPSSSVNPGGPQPPQPGDAELQVTGTWTPPSSVTGWTRVMAAIPNEGAWDPEASYQVVPGSGKATQYRVINQAWQTDTWVDLGVYDLSAGAHVSLSNVTYEGLGEDIAWDAVAFVPVSAPAASYVAMGDSYSSGEGIQPYDPDSDFSYLGMLNACHRSVSGAYPRMVAASLGSDAEFHFTACSGAETTQLSIYAVDDPATTYDNDGNTDWGQLQDLYGELPQTDQGWLTPQTTLVTLSVGGNDARFSDVLTGCILTLSDCINPGYKLTRHSNGKVDPQPLTDFEPVVIGLLKSHLLSVYRDIAALAPNAEIIVLGYPELFPASPPASCLIGLGLSLSGADQAWLNKMGSMLDSTVHSAVSAVAAQGVNIHYVDPVPGYTGHEICSPNPWINGLVSWSRSGSGLKVPGAGSFHPTLAGQQEYARLVEGCLAGTVPC